MASRSQLLISVFVFSLVLAACAGGATANPPADLPPAVVEDSTLPVAEENSNTVEEPATEVPANDAPTDTGNTFVFSQSESQARFKIWEVLLGQETEVIGVTNAVEGSLSVDLNDPQSLSISPVIVNMTGLATDNNNRNGQIHRAILQMSIFPTATFVTTGFSGLPGSVAVGDTFSFQLNGDLTIHDITNPVTFDVTVTVASENRLEGLATLGILYEDYGVQILRLPSQVASVEPDVVLELQFVAEK